MANEDFIDALEHLLRVSAYSIECENKSWVSASLRPRIGGADSVCYNGTPFVTDGGKLIIGVFDDNYELQSYSLREYIDYFIKADLTIEVSAHGLTFDWEP